MSSINPASLNRITGIVSGMDTDSLVKKLMAGEQAKIDQLKQNQQKNLWMSDSYRQWNNDLNSYRTTLFNAKMSSTYNTFAVTSSQPNCVTASAGGGATAGIYNIQVKQLAQSASFTGNNIVIDPTKTLGDPAQNAFQLTSNTSFDLTVFNDPNNPFKVNIPINTTDKIGDIASRINNAVDGSGKNLGLQAFYDANLKQFVIKTKSLGASQRIDLNFTDNNLSKYMNQSIAGTYSTNGQNADIFFNGTEINNLKSNTATIMGISWTFKSPTVDSNGVPTSTAVNVSQDIDTEVKNIKDIINSYNDMLTKLNNAYAEPVYKDYKPLTDDQRSAMSETQVQQWETKAKSGLLHGDSLIGSLINKLRNNMIGKVNNGSVYNSLSSIGISSQSYIDKGKLTVDETKLRDAIQADPDGVQKLFNQSGSTTNGTNGLLNTLTDSISQVAKNLTTKAGTGEVTQYDQSVIGKLLTGLQTQISTETDKYQQMEDRYYKQFSAMETAMQKYNSQSSWLSSQMSAGQG